MPYPDEEWQSNHMREMAAQIWEWKREYYFGRASVDDSTYDLWERNLRFLEKKYPHLKAKNSPTDAVGSPMEED